MKLTSESLSDGARIADAHCFCRPSTSDPVEMSDNISPHLAWTDAPAETRSFVVICHDADVPTVGDDVNQAGRTVPHDLPRADFFHWVLVDVQGGELPAGAHSRGITARGKDGPSAPGDARHGLNDYTGWFAGDADMAGEYFGFDGPCPPWNDERLHHYHFTVFALDVARCPVEGTFGGDDVRKAIQGHVLDSASMVCTYSLNPAVYAADA
ncbi:MAG: YbhB/YbcL family Raf kinase inhibitor-like protein [Myxococcales bacterium]|nr:YbhB/YbcL family Raf kinase inhibitor-like protein [Myxococcales bacterium]